MRWDVLALGAVAVDDFLFVERYPEVDTKERVLATRRAPGGLAGTALVAAARFGVRCAYLGVFGSDELSAYVREDLEREGVDCSPCLRKEGAAPFHTIAVTDRRTGSRTLFVDGSGFREPPGEAIDDALVGAARVVCVDHTVPDAAVRAATFARERGIPVVADLEVDAGEQVTGLLPLVDHLVVGADMAARLSGGSGPAEAAAELSRRWRSTAVVTAGDRGCWYCTAGGQPAHHAALRVEPVDTNGCGDVFHGVYAAALSLGMETPVAVRYATVAAGLKAGHPDGGRSGIPDRAEAARHLGQEHP